MPDKIAYFSWMIDRGTSPMRSREPGFGLFALSALVAMAGGLGVLIAPLFAGGDFLIIALLAFAIGLIGLGGAPLYGRGQQAGRKDQAWMS